MRGGGYYPERMVSRTAQRGGVKSPQSTGPFEACGQIAPIRPTIPRARRCTDSGAPSGPSRVAFLQHKQRLVLQVLLRLRLRIVHRPLLLVVIRVLFFLRFVNNSLRFLGQIVQRFNHHRTAAPNGTNSGGYNMISSNTGFAPRTIQQQQ